MSERQNIKIVIWMNFPSHHQSHFFKALRFAGVDLHVYYYDKISEDRIRLGWHNNEVLSKREQYIDNISDMDRILQETRDFVHIIPPSMGSKFIRKLIKSVIKFRMKWIIWSEGTIPGLRKLVVFTAKRYLGYLVNRYALGALAISVLARDEFISWGIEPSKISLLSYSVPSLPENVQPDEKCMTFRQGRKIFLYLGSLNKRKAIDILLKAFADVHISCSDKNEWGLIVVGSDLSDGYYKGLAKIIGISDKTLFLDPVPYDRISTVLKIADVFILPSRYDGWGVVLNEAASLGKPLISTDRCGGAFHLIRHEENGFRVKAGDAAQLADAMKQYIESPELIETHGARSKEIFADFHPDKNAQSLITTLNRWIMDRGSDLKESHDA